MKRVFALLMAAAILCGLAGCKKKNGGTVELKGRDLELQAQSEYFNNVGEHVLSYELGRAVQQKDGSVVFAHTFTSHSALRITCIVSEFIYYASDGSVMAHKQLTCNLEETPLAPDGTYTYYSTNNFSGAIPFSMEARVTRADTEFETPILPKPNTDSDFFDFFTDGRYEGLSTAFIIEPPATMYYKADNEAQITVSDAAQIKQVYDAMRKIHVGEKSETNVTDSGATYVFILNDGTEYTVRFESSTLLPYGTECYELSGAEELFAIRLHGGSYSQEAGNDYERGKEN